MKGSLSATILLLSLLSPWPFASPAYSEPRKPPHAVVATTEIDLGSRGLGEPALAKFSVRNEGDEPLQIEVGPPGSQLQGARVEVTGAPVGPGKEATIVATLDTENVAGNRRYSITLTTNDPNAARLLLQVSLDVRPLLLADPPSVRYAAIEGDRESGIAQTVWSSDGATFRVLRVEPSTPDLNVKFEEAKPDERRAGVSGSQWRIVSTFPSTTTSKSIVGNVVVVTDHPRQKRLRVPIVGVVKPLFSALPSVAVLGPDATGEERQLTITLWSARDVTIDRVQSSVPGLAVEIESVQPNRVYKLRVSAKDTLPEGPVEGTIDVHTGGQPSVTFKIPVRRLMSPPPGSDQPG